MKKVNAIKMICVLISLLLVVICGCGLDKKNEQPADNNIIFDEEENAEEIITDAQDKDFSTIKTPGSQETAYEYKNFFLPAVDGIKQPYVGDCMPYYEDGVYYIYYLKEGGDSYNHSIYLATTTDFVSYEEQDEPVIEASKSGGQDAWTGTGCVTKIDGTYYFFYSAHSSGNTTEFAETIMLAKSDNLRSFEKVEGWELTPDPSLKQKRDFRDPQAYYDESTGMINMTVTACQDGKARILKYTLSKDLTEITYDGIIFTDEITDVYNLECTDTFKIGDVYYVTYSAQDDTLWYACSDAPYGPYSEPVRLDDKLFYAAKHVTDGNNIYMVGWTRRSESPSSTTDVMAWGGNMQAQQLRQLDDGRLILEPVEAVKNQYNVRRPLLIDGNGYMLSAGSLYGYKEMFTAYESFMLTGKFKYEGEGSFGLAFDFDGTEEEYKLISISPKKQTISLLFNGGTTNIAEKEIDLKAGEEYEFTYIQEGSAGVFYINGETAFTVRVYGISGKSIRLFAENNNVTFTSLKEYTR